MDFADFGQYIDERIHLVSNRLQVANQRLAENILDSTIDSYGNLFEKVIGLQSVLKELNLIKEQL